MAAGPKITEVMSQIVELLTPLESSERHRVVRAAFTLLGESQTEKLAQDEQNSVGDEGNQNLPTRANAWLRQQGVSSAQLEQVFHTQDGQVEVIATDIPGKGKKGQTINSYVLQGIRGLLSSGEPTFEDKTARQLCKHLGCYDEANHALIIKESGNLWIGSKDKGWRLTTPGLRYAGNLIKSMTTISK